MRTKLKLPLTTLRFLRTARGRRARTAVHALHRWLDGRGLPLEQLTPELFQRFLTWPHHVRITPKSSCAYWTRLRDYLRWLGERALLGFNPKHLRRQLISLPPLAREFLASLAPTHRPSTCGCYASSLRGFYGWLDERELDPQKLTRREIASWFQEMHAGGLSSVTRHGLLIQVRVYLRWLSERQGMRAEPDDLVRPSDIPKLPLYLPRPLTTEADRELQRRLAAFEDPRAWALLLMRRTGLRISELCGLEFHCSRLDERRPLLKVPLGKMNNERLVPLDPDSVELVRRLQAAGPRPRSWLVPGRSSRKIDFWRLSDVLEVASRGLPDPARITSHRLRHTYATELISAGMSLVGVMRLLGHRDYRMTLRYAAITPETIGDEYQKALAKLATKYQLPTTATMSASENATDPVQLLEHLSRWVLKYATSREAPRALMRRIERLQRDVGRLRSSLKK